jgi:flagellar FliL protein
MASAAATAEVEAEAEAPVGGQEITAPQRSSPFAFIAVMLILTALGVGFGGLLGLQLLSRLEGDASGKAGRKESASAGSGAQAAKGRIPPGANVRSLAPIVTNLGGPGRTWIRLEASLVFDGDPPGEAVLSAQITEDIVAYLRTVSLLQIQGPSGFQHLREDLNDRVRVRSGGKVRDLVIQAMIVE